MLHPWDLYGTGTALGWGGSGWDAVAQTETAGFLELQGVSESYLRGIIAAGGRVMSEADHFYGTGQKQKLMLRQCLAL
jgi:hypothetical protein